jgi:DNA-binding response OmpR family regulator
MANNTHTILVIEDEPLLLQAIAKKLQRLGMEAVTCTKTKQAFDYLKNLPKLPDVIWLDYYLQDSTGLEFMTELKKNKEWENIPVIVVSNSASDKKVHSLLALGVKKYLLKAEYRLDEIVAEISKIIDNVDH